MDQAGDERDENEWTLIWSDEFTGNTLDLSKWNYDYGNGPNHELENYTDAASNVRLGPHPGNPGSRCLTIQANEEETVHDGKRYHFTSGRINTKGKFSFTYGKVEMSAMLPYGQGIWPAFWMLGDDISSVGWPNCGEIDIMEYIGKTPARTYGTLHGPGYSGGQGIGTHLETSGTLSTKFHKYGLEWGPKQIKWFFDDQIYQTRTPHDLNGKRWVFDHPFYLILNLAVGGDWPGNPDSTTRFPQTFCIDYVRVYQRKIDSAKVTGS